MEKGREPEAGRAGRWLAIGKFPGDGRIGWSSEGAGYRACLAMSIANTLSLAWRLDIVSDYSLMSTVHALSPYIMSGALC